MSTDNRKQKRNRILSWIINLAGVLAFGLILYLGGIEAWQQIVHGDWRYVLAAFGVTLLWNLVAAYRWSLIAHHVTEEPSVTPYRYYFTYHMLGMMVGQVLPITVGMLGGRPVALSLSRGVSLKRAGLSVLLDKLFDLLLAVLLVTPVALYLVDWISQPLALGLMVGLVAVGALLVGWQYERGIELVAKTGARLAQPLQHLPVLGPRLARRLPQQLDSLANRSFVSNRLALRSFLLTLVMYSLLAARLNFVAQALHLEIPWYILVMGIAVTQLALIFSVTPGSLGFLEGGWAAVMGLAGIPLELFAIFVIGRRAYLLVFTSIVTLLAFAWIRQSPAHLFGAVLTASRQPDKEVAEPMVNAYNGAEPEPQNGSPSLVAK